MQIFAKKHFTNKNSFFPACIFYLAIWMRASLAIGKRILASLLLPILDVLFIYGGMLSLAFYWQIQVLQYRSSFFPNYYFYMIIPCYIVIWIISIAMNKGYRKPYSTSKTNRGIILGTIIILLIYAILPETYRFSRAVTIFGAIWTAISMNTLRYLLHLIKLKGYQYANLGKRRILIVGNVPETERVALIAQTENQKPEIIFTTITLSSGMLRNYVKEHKINELILCSKDVSIKQVITYFIDLKDFSISYKMAPENEPVIVASRYIQELADVQEI